MNESCTRYIQTAGNFHSQKRDGNEIITVAKFYWPIKWCLSL